MIKRTLILTAAAALVSGCGPTGGTGSQTNSQASSTPTSVIAAHAGATQSGVPAGATQPAASDAPVVKETTARRAPDARTTSYVAVVSRNGRYRVVVVSKSNGKVLREVTNTRVTDEWGPYTGAALAPDGSVWVVMREPTSAEEPYDAYASKLIHYTAEGARTVVPYVEGVRISPDGSRLALAVLSPDGDGDGKGRYSLRIADANGKTLRTLASETFPVDETGQPTMETRVPYPKTWLGNQRVVVMFGCCDSGSLAIVPTTKVTSMNTWKTFDGDSQTTVLGRFGDEALLVARSTWGGKGTEADPERQIGFESYRISERDMKGKRLRSVRTEQGLEAAAEKLLAGTGATRLWVAPGVYPYAGAGKVVNVFS